MGYPKFSKLFPGRLGGATRGFDAGSPPSSPGSVMGNEGTIVPFKAEATGNGEGLCSIQIRGEFDLGNAEEVHQLIAQGRRNGSALLLIDMTNCRFIDSSGILALIKNQRASASEGGPEIVLVGVHGVVGRTLRLAGVDKVIPIFARRGAEDPFDRQRRSVIALARRPTSRGQEAHAQPGHLA